MNSLIKYFWLFIFGSFFGFVIETIWCMIRWRKIESRKGLIYGHFIPIYGFAGVLVAVILELFSISKKKFMFLVAFIIGGIVEYFSSLFQEKVTGTLSWDYSDMKFNLHGRINFVYLMGFGLFGILWGSIYPKFLDCLYNIFNTEGILIIVTVLMSIFMGYNIFISLVAMIRQKKRRNKVAAQNKFEIWLDKKYPDDFLKKVYANSVFVD